MLSCHHCKQCNRKGKPSVMRGSAYCDTHRKTIGQVNRSGLFHRFKDFLFDKRAKFDDKGRMKEFKKKGFRKDWFIR